MQREAAAGRLFAVVEGAQLPAAQHGIVLLQVHVPDQGADQQAVVETGRAIADSGAAVSEDRIEAIASVEHGVVAAQGAARVRDLYGLCTRGADHA